MAPKSLAVRSKHVIISLRLSGRAGSSVFGEAASARSAYRWSRTCPTAAPEPRIRQHHVLKSQPMAPSAPCPGSGQAPAAPARSHQLPAPRGQGRGDTGVLRTVPRPGLWAQPLARNYPGAALPLIQDLPISAGSEATPPTPAAKGKRTAPRAGGHARPPSTATQDPRAAPKAAAARPRKPVSFHAG